MMNFAFLISAIRKNEGFLFLLLVTYRNAVAPYTGAWIETGVDAARTIAGSRTLYGCVD